MAASQRQGIDLGRMKRQIYLDYAYSVADLIWQDYDALRVQAIERDKAALRDQGKLQNIFQSVETVAPAEAMRYKQTDIEDLNKRPAYSFDARRERVFDPETDAYSAVTTREDNAT